MESRHAGRVLAVDWGQKRFGLAISDPGRMIAQPLTTLTRRPKQRAPVGRIVDLAQRHAVSEIVMGLPLTPEGEEGEAAREARECGEAIAARSGLPVRYADERMTTRIALRAARRAGVSDAKSRERLDQMAAVALLQAYLDGGSR